MAHSSKNNRKNLGAFKWREYIFCKEKTIIVYATKIDSDIVFPFTLPHHRYIRYKRKLSSHIPKNIERLLTCGIKLYKSHGREVYVYSDREFSKNEKGQPLCYEVEGIVRFYWISGSKDIYYELDKHIDVKLFGFWFIHLFLPLYMAFEGMYDFMHAGAVEVEGKAILFIAPSMGGKSTMTDYFLQQGHMLISDDKVATYVENGYFMSVPSFPYHRPYREFEDLGYYTNYFSGELKPIHAIYELKRVTFSAKIKIEEMKGYKKFDALLPNYLYVFSWLKQERFKYFSQMLDSVKVFRITVPWDMERLEEVYEAICTHTDSLN